MPSVLALLTFGLVASAAVISERATCLYGRLYVDTYDDIGNFISAILPELTPVGTYHGLVYTGFAVVDPTLEDEIPVVDSTPLAGISLNGFAPHSGDHYAGLAVQETITSGEAEGVTVVPIGNLTRGPGVTSFDLFSFYFGCEVDAGNAVATSAEGCTISVTGTYINGGDVATYTAAYTPQKVNGSPMQLVTLPATFVGLASVEIGVSSGVSTPALTIVGLDDVSHCNH